MKDALKAEERCSDGCYAGCSRYMPGFQKVVDHATPEPLKALPQSHMCLAVSLFNMVLLAIYCYFWSFSYQEVRSCFRPRRHHQPHPRCRHDKKF